MTALFTLFLLALTHGAKAQSCGALSLSTSAGPNHMEVTHSWTAIGEPGSVALYRVYGRPENGTYSDPLTFYLSAGQNFTQTVNH